MENRRLNTTVTAYYGGNKIFCKIFETQKVLAAF